MSDSFEGKVALRSWMRACRYVSQSLKAGLKRSADYVQMFDSRVYEVALADVVALDSVCGNSYEGEGCPPFAPFDNVYVGFTGGLVVDTHGEAWNEVHQRLWNAFGFDVMSLSLVGLTIQRESASAWVNVAGYYKNGDFALSSMPFILYEEGKWNKAEINSFIGVDVVLGVCQMLHAPQKKYKVTPGLVAESRRRAKGQRRAIPKPYYVIHPGSHYCVPKVRRKLKRRGGDSLAYRHDRMAHERVLVHRGISLSTKDKQIMVDRGYRVYDDGNPTVPAPDLHRLLSREHPMRKEGEWLAVKGVNVSACVVGREDLPYIPAVRTTGH